jgi:SAM-dependent methyltransferase
MERAEWLKLMRTQAEGLYDEIAPAYWGTFGFYDNWQHLEFLKKFLARIPSGGTVLSAGCGAGRYDGLLLEAGHSVIGIDQSEGMLRRAREHFPAVKYERIGLQEMDFHTAFDGVTCIDAMEHVCPEDWPGIVRNFYEALKPHGVLYFTLELSVTDELDLHYHRALELGLPVVFGEVADRVTTSYEGLKAAGPSSWKELADSAVYHYYPQLDQVCTWVTEAGFRVEEEGTGSGYQHYIARRPE